LKSHLEHIRRLADDRAHNSSSVDTIERRLADVSKSSQQTVTKHEESQSQVDQNRALLAEMQIELENQRFGRRRVEEDLVSLKRKAEELTSILEGSSLVEKLRKELTEYRDILKCRVCNERRKEVVITKCFHLFCNPCIQHIVETRHRKCPSCSASFGVNDVKPVYI
ncbi:hypothetical protein M569_16780, partial [Genlisea aurea]